MYMTTKEAVQLNFAMTQTILTASEKDGVRAKTALKERQRQLNRRRPQWDQRRPNFS